MSSTNKFPTSIALQTHYNQGISNVTPHTAKNQSLAFSEAFSTQAENIGKYK